MKDDARVAALVGEHGRTFRQAYFLQSRLVLCVPALLMLVTEVALVHTLGLLVFPVLFLILFFGFVAIKQLSRHWFLPRRAARHERALRRDGLTCRIIAVAADDFPAVAIARLTDWGDDLIVTGAAQPFIVERLSDGATIWLGVDAAIGVVGLPEDFPASWSIGDEVFVRLSASLRKPAPPWFQPAAAGYRMSIVLAAGEGTKVRLPPPVAPVTAGRRLS